MARPLEPLELDHLRSLEESLWRAETRFDRGYMERLLHEDFVEFGRSGRVYDRAAILALPRGPIDAELPLPGLRIALVADDVALVTYTSRVADGASIAVGNRSSLWVRSAGGWKLRFHQGTPAAVPAEPAAATDRIRGA